MNFFSKAKTIENLNGKIQFSNVLPIIIFTINQYKKNKTSVLEEIQKKFSSDKLIIRSSAINEDTLLTSNAGHFDSILNVNLNNKKEILVAIDKVVSSIKGNSNNEVFVQPMLQNMSKCGVAFTADLDTLSPYYIINFDETGSPDAVTSGLAGEFKTFIQLKNAELSNTPSIIKKLIIAFKELEKLFNNNYLDIEFGVNEKNEIFIFQVRPIVINDKVNYYNLSIKEALFKVEKKLQKLRAPHPNLYGENAIFGVMPDWNPAEIIGIRPKRLSLSLYKEFITDNIWAFQRDNYGYRNLRSHPLLVSFLGVPYIDVRVDFNSFIPKNLSENTAKKLVEFCLNKLSETPSYHDKIEFKIVHSCYYFNLSEKLNELIESGFTNKEVKEIETSLVDLTNEIINPKFGHFKKDIEKIEELVNKKDTIINSNLSKIDKIYWLTEYCKRYGTLPFAGIARAAFISTQILKSLVDIKVINRDEYNDFLKSLKTITSEMGDDLNKLVSSKITKKNFLEKYGHLRPGTYDILSPRYDESFDSYFSGAKAKEPISRTFSFSKSIITKLDYVLETSKLKISSSDLIKFIKDSIEGREHAKFVFTSCLSEILRLVESLGESAGKSKEEMAHVDFRTILNLYQDLDHQFLNQVFDADIIKFKKLYEYTQAVKLPSLILEPNDVYAYYLQLEEPNFISLNKIQSKVILEDNLSSENLENNIILIQSADPGFDYLFSKKIGGLITQYGGANSHMAVRCAELGIPAVIGAGEQNFKLWSNSKVLEIDSANKMVKMIS